MQSQSCQAVAFLFNTEWIAKKSILNTRTDLAVPAIKFIWDDFMIFCIRIIAGSI